jgi:hypothetical protein
VHICDRLNEWADDTFEPALVLFEQVDGRWLIAGDRGFKRKERWCDPAYGPDDSIVELAGIPVAA